MFDSFTSCIADTPEKLSRAPEVSFPEMLSQPWMFMQQFKRTVALEQLQRLANAHCWWQFDKQMHMVNSDVQFVDLAPISPSSSPQDSLAIHPHTKELHRVSGIFRFPHEVERVLSERVFPGFQIHFFPPANPTRNPAHAKFANLTSGAQQSLSHANTFKELNVEDGNSSLGFKTEVSLPLM